jgi:hypothetical protein
MLALLECGLKSASLTRRGRHAGGHEGRVFMRMGAVAFAVGLLAAGVPSGAVERLSLRVSPAVALAPATLRVRATVERMHENRSIEIVVESEAFYRSSEVSLDGDRAPRTNLLEYRGLPAGAYQVRAILRGVSGRELAWTNAHLNIVDENTDAF